MNGNSARSYKVVKYMYPLYIICLGCFFLVLYVSLHFLIMKIIFCFKNKFDQKKRLTKIVEKKNVLRNITGTIDNTRLFQF